MISYIFLIRLLSIYHVIYSSCDGLIWWQKSFLDEQGNQKIDSWNENISNCFRWSINDKQLLDRWKNLQAQLNFLIEKFEGKYFTNNHIWSTLKSYFIGKKNSCTPLLLENNEHFTDFKKAELFYLLINKNSQLSISLPYRTNESQSSVDMWYFHLQTIEALFQSLHRQWYISMQSEKANIVPIHNKGEK